MNHCVRLFLLIAPALAAVVLLGVAFSTDWWMISIEKHFPQGSPLNVTDDARVHSTLIPQIVSRGLLTECLRYHSAKILVSNSFDFREELSHEDQLRLATENCSSTQIKCTKGVAIRRPLTHCIDRSKRCDGMIDCEDKSDELFCDAAGQQVACRPDYTRCRDDKVCFRRNEQTCDGVSNCLDDSDEQNCNEERCEANKRVYCPRERKCSRRENSYRCDGIVDCEDNSDEENCQRCNGQPTPHHCDSKCFLRKYKCDGVVHCSDLTDELNCTDYSSTTNSQGDLFRLDRLCQEKRFNPFIFFPPRAEAYQNSDQRGHYHSIMYYLQFTAFYGVAAGIILLFLAIISLFFVSCCRGKCLGVPFYFYGLWILFAWVSICVALVAFVGMWWWKKQSFLDYETNSPFNIMMYQRNPSLQSIEFFGLSFWLACGAALATFIGLMLSCCVCCTIGSARSENKEYEIMHMQNY